MLKKTRKKFPIFNSYWTLLKVSTHIVLNILMIFIESNSVRCYVLSFSPQWTLVFPKLTTSKKKISNLCCTVRTLFELSQFTNFHTTRLNSFALSRRAQDVTCLYTRKREKEKFVDWIKFGETKKHQDQLETCEPIILNCFCQKRK